MAFVKLRPLALGLVFFILRPLALGMAPVKLLPLAPESVLSILQLLVTVLVPIALQQQVMLVLEQSHALEMLLV